MQIFHRELIYREENFVERASLIELLADKRFAFQRRFPYQKGKHLCCTLITVAYRIFIPSVSANKVIYLCTFLRTL